MNNPDSLRKISRDELDERRYLESLLKAALTKEVVDSSFIEKVRFSLLDLLALKCRKYNGIDSSSLRMEVAEDIMKSIVFTLGIWLKNIREPDDALLSLAETGIHKGFDIGFKKLENMVKSTRMFYSIVLNNNISTENYMYNVTINGGIQGFFKLYNSEYTAHKIHITADYPVCFYPDGYQGIEFIRLYLQNIHYENQFIWMFDETAIRQCFALYAINNNESVRDIYMNLYEAVLSASLACAAAGDDISGLKLTERGKEKIRELAAVNQDIMMGTYLENVIEQLEKTNLISELMKNYLENTCLEYGSDLNRMMLLMADYWLEP
ncbi:MAG: DUF6179 domain-containing protein [Sedimentibacter sp.]|uniref:DUF6179 domain-containing protein n=1 Tax=Sedimentibacter sp. TaxID=1960295 RepID=UPI0031598801